MKHLLINNFGPISSADLQLSRMGVIVGPQSVGKNSVLKVAAFFAWMEKRIELTQDIDGISKNAVKDHLIDYYGLSDYVHNDTYLRYETDLVVLEYKNQHMTASWGKRDGITTAPKFHIFLRKEILSLPFPIGIK